MSNQPPSYITERLDDQIFWYVKKAAQNKMQFRICQIIIIISSAGISIVSLGIPLINPKDPCLFTKALGMTTVLGGIITIVTAFSQMDSYSVTWVLYRTTVEVLKRERFLFLNNAADYSDLQDIVKNKLFVERIEAMLSSENSKFLSLQQQARQQSEQQLNELLQKQREINKKQREELLELQAFRIKYKETKPARETYEEIENVRSCLLGVNFPTNKQSIQTYIELNKSKIKNANSVEFSIEKLQARGYLSLKEIKNELIK